MRQHHVGLIAVVIAVIGVPTAWALGRNTVGSAQLKPNAVKEADIANSAVTGEKVKDGSLTDNDFAGPGGPEGPPGPPGPQGQQGVAGEDGTEIVVSPTGNASATDNSGPVNFSMTGNTWTQPANELHQVAGGSVTFTPPATCLNGAITVRIIVDGVQRTQADGPTFNSSPTATQGPVFFPFNLQIPNSNQPHTLTATVTDNCAGGENYSNLNLEMRVIAIR